MSMIAEIESILTVQNLYIGSMPKTPDSAVAIYNTGGFPRELTDSEMEINTFQVKVRSATYDAGQTVCELVKDQLHGYSDDEHLLLIQQMGGTMDLGRDENNRPLFSLNFRAFYKK